MPTAARINTAISPEPIKAALFRRANLPKRYRADGGQACTGSSSRYRRRSAAIPLAVSYRRVRSFSSAFITIQSSSPRTSPLSFRGSTCRFAAMLGSSSVVLSRTLGQGESSSRITRNTSRNAACVIRLRSSGVDPVSSS